MVAWLFHVILGWSIMMYNQLRASLAGNVCPYLLNENTGAKAGLTQKLRMHFRENYRRVPLLAEYIPQRRTDLARRKDLGRHLVELGLKEVMIGAIDKNHLDWRPAKCPCGRQFAETSTDDDDAWSPLKCVLGCHL